jgi:nucleoid-associated protein YgaU
LNPERSLPVVVMENGNQFPQTHRVQWGDSFFSVAQKYYRDGRWFHALYLANKDKVQDFDLLPKGTMLLIPSPERLAERFPKFAVPEPLDKQSLDSAANRIYETKANDTLFDISRRKLGQGSRYLEIIKQNESRLPRSIGASEVLPANLRLVLPVSSVQ